jgi:nucleoside-diphosphate-sugar epimerase
LAGEHLCRAYESNFGLPVTVLRFFSVYGPRQRPDMAYRILINALLHGATFPLFGDGTQSRSNTFVSDCVRGVLLAFEQPELAKGDTFNLGGGQVVTLSEVIALLEELTGRQAVIERKPARPGDQKHTCADITHLSEKLGYAPTTSVEDGLKAQVAWQKTL